jgi:hypothetical protein
MGRSINRIQEFIDELPPEFDAVKHKAERLLDHHRNDVINAYLAAGRGSKDTLSLMEDAEDYYERKHVTK